MTKKALPDSDSWNPWNHPTAWQSLRTGLIVAVVLGLGIWAALTQVVGEHITDCGFDAHGAYAKVRVNNLLGGSHEQRVWVAFHIDDDVAHYKPGGDSYYALGSVTTHLPALGSATTVMHGPFPPHGSFVNTTALDLHVKGRTVYRWRYAGRLVTKKFAEKHPNRTKVETVPDDRTSLDCSIWKDDD